MVEDEAIVKALDFLEAGDEMTDEQLDALMADDAVGQAVSDLLDCKQAAMAAYPLLQPDTDAEWQRFSRRHLAAQPLASQDSPLPPVPQRRARRYMLYGSVLGVAATLLFLIGFGWMHRRLDEGTAAHGSNADVVLAAVDKNPGVVLQAADGTSLQIDKTTSQSSLARLGMKLKGSGVAALQAKAEDIPQNLTLSIPRGQTFDLTLSDGTVVCLNTDSRLVYPSHFSGKERRVRLEGEAYFKVAKDAEHPFIVETQHIETRVLGTQFNVRAYGDGDAHVTLIDGSVELHSKGTATRLKPGQDAMLLSDGTLETTEVDIDSYVYWSEGFFYFDNVSLLSIMQDIGRWYNVNVVFRNTAAKDYKLHFLCDRKGTLDHTVRLLNSIRKVTLEVSGDTLYVN